LLFLQGWCDCLFALAHVQSQACYAAEQWSQASEGSVSSVCSIGPRICTRAACRQHPAVWTKQRAPDRALTRSALASVHALHVDNTPRPDAHNGKASHICLERYGVLPGCSKQRTPLNTHLYKNNVISSRVVSRRICDATIVFYRNVVLCMATCSGSSAPPQHGDEVVLGEEALERPLPSLPVVLASSMGSGMPTRAEDLPQPHAILCRWRLEAGALSSGEAASKCCFTCCETW